jgi:hypothetical protein
VERLTTANIVMHQNAVRFLQFMSHLPIRAIYDSAWLARN